MAGSLRQGLLQDEKHSEVLNGKTASGSCAKHATLQFDFRTWQFERGYNSQLLMLGIYVAMSTASFMATNNLGDAVVLIELGSLILLRVAVRQRIDLMTARKWTAGTLMVAIALAGMAEYQGRQVEQSPVEWASAFIGDIMQMPAFFVLMALFGMLPVLVVFSSIPLFPTLLTTYFALGDGRVKLDPSWNGIDSVALQYMGLTYAASLIIVLYLERQNKREYTYLRQIAQASEVYAEHASSLCHDLDVPITALEAASRHLTRAMKATLQIDDEQQPDETDAQHAQHAQGAGGQRGGEGRRGSAALPGQQAGEGVPQPWPALLRSLGASLELLQWLKQSGADFGGERSNERRFSVKMQLVSIEDLVSTLHSIVEISPRNANTQLQPKISCEVASDVGSCVVCDRACALLILLSVLSRALERAGESGVRVRVARVDIERQQGSLAAVSGVRVGAASVHSDGSCGDGAEGEPGAEGRVRIEVADARMGSPRWRYLSSFLGAAASASALPSPQLRRLHALACAMSAVFGHEESSEYGDVYFLELPCGGESSARLAGAHVGARGAPTRRPLCESLLTGNVV